MEILPEIEVDEREWAFSGGMTDAIAADVPIQSDTVFAAAILQWNQLPHGTQIPELDSAELADGTFRSGKAMQIVWREGLVGQTVTYMGDELVREFGVGAGEIWPGRPDRNALPSLLRRLSEQSICWGRPINLREEMVSGGGALREYRVLALPFSVTQSSEKLVTVIFDWFDEGIRYSDGYYEIGEIEAPDSPDFNTLQDVESVLLLEQELVGDGASGLPAQKNATLPYFVVSVAEQQKPVQSQSAEPDRKGKIGDNSNFDQSRERLFIMRPAVGLQSGAGQEQEEPLLLTEVIEPLGQSSELLLRNELDLVASLETARDHASAALITQERSHTALYAAIGAAHDFSLCAFEAPGEYQIMLDAAGLKAQARAPFTPIVKLVFGVDYDRSRLAEYAVALAHAQRVGVPCGCFADYLAGFDGGLKALVKEERQQKRQGASSESQFDRVKDRLRKAQPQTFDALDPGDEEFVLVLARRLPDGGIAMVGKVPEDERLLSRAAHAFLSK